MTPKDLPELPEPDAHMYPSDLEKFKTRETWAQAFSVAVGNPDERSEPLFTEAAMNAHAAAAYDLGARSTAAQPVEPMVSYSHVTGGARFRQRACDQLPPWAYDVRLEPPAASGDSTPPSAPVQGDPSGAPRAEPEAVGHGSVEGDVRALRQMVADCEVYLKEGETPAQRIERERRDTEAVLNLLIREKQRTEAMREVMLRMMAGIDHLAEIARQWEPDYSSGADRRGWVLAKDARDDAARLIAETPQAASGSSQGARSDVLSIDVVEQRLLTWRQRFMNKSGDRLALDDFMGQESIDDLIDFVCSPPAQSAEQGATPPAPAALVGDGEQLWLWQNGDHFLAFRHLYPCFSPGGDPMTLGEPYGRAIFKHSHNRQGKPNEQQRTDRQSPRSSTDPDLQRRQAASAGQACSVGAGASLGHGQHQIAPQGGWGAGDDGARQQSVPDIAGAAGVLAAGRNVAQGVAVQGDPSGAPRAEPEAVGQGRWWRKKPVVIEAFQWNGLESGCQAAKARFPELETSSKSGHLRRPEVTSWHIRTLEGHMRVSPGDWIVRGVAGEFYPCKPDIFAATYEPAEPPQASGSRGD